MGEQTRLIQFKSAHVSILTTLDEIGSVVRQYNAAKPLVRSLEEKLFSYFQLQTKMLKALDGKYVKPLREDLKVLKVSALLFFDQYPADMGDVSPVAFPKHFYEFDRQIRSRLRFEEQYLFSLL